MEVPKIKNITQVGFGGGAIADYPWHLDGSKPWTEADSENAIKVLNSTMETSITLIDTAHRYGNGQSEKVIGNFLRQLPEPIKSRYFVVTKIDLGTASEMYDKLERSICRLGQRPQALLLHNPDFGREWDVDHACQWMEKDVRAMGIKFIGMSTEPVGGVEQFYKRYSLNVIQFPYSYHDTRAEQRIFPWINTGRWVLKIANRVLSGPDLNSKPDPRGCIEYVLRKKDCIDVALIGTMNSKHLIQCDLIMKELQEKKARKV